MPGTRKRLVVCCDGTWNSPEQQHVTNVVRTARAVRPTDNAGVHQVVFYDWGIGSHGNRIRGGMLGKGIDKNIQDAYRFLVHNHADGDEIFLFGFSRGAYTARSLGRLYSQRRPARKTAFPPDCRRLRTLQAAGRAGRAGGSRLSPRPLPRGANQVCRRLGYRRSPGRAEPGFQEDGRQPPSCVSRHLVEQDHRSRLPGGGDRRATHRFRTDALAAAAERRPDHRTAWFAGVHGDVGAAIPMPVSPMWPWTGCGLGRPPKSLRSIEPIGMRRCAPMLRARCIRPGRESIGSSAATSDPSAICRRVSKACMIRCASAAPMCNPTGRKTWSRFWTAIPNPIGPGIVSRDGGNENQYS